MGVLNTSLQTKPCKIFVQQTNTFVDVYKIEGRYRMKSLRKKPV